MSDGTKNLILSIVLSAIVLVAWQFFFNRDPTLTPLQKFVRAHITDFAFQILFAWLVLLTGWGLFSLRTRRRRVYAAIEVISGLGAAVYAANTFYDAAAPDDRAKAVFATIAGLYVIVRGMDNWREGTKIIGEAARAVAAASPGNVPLIARGLPTTTLVVPPGKILRPKK